MTLSLEESPKQCLLRRIAQVFNTLHGSNTLNLTRYVLQWVVKGINLGKYLVDIYRAKSLAKNYEAQKTISDARLL